MGWGRGQVPPRPALRPALLGRCSNPLGALGLGAAWVPALFLQTQLAPLHLPCSLGPAEPLNFLPEPQKIDPGS